MRAISKIALFPPADEIRIASILSTVVRLGERCGPERASATAEDDE